MSHEETVSIHLPKAELLARVLAAAAMDLDERALEVSALLREVGEETGPARRISEVGAWVALEERRLRALVVAVRAADERSDRALGFEVLGGRIHPSHRRPARAHLGALRALRAHRSGDRELLALLLRSWWGDPVFAEELLSGMGAASLVEELRTLGMLLAYPAEHPDRVAQEELVGLLAAAVATASRFGPSPIPVADLVAAARRDGVQIGVVGLLALRDQRWSPRLLAEMVDALVIPLNAVVAGGSSGPVHRFGTAADPIDSRVAVLAAVAADRRAAHMVLARCDLGALLDARADYDDGGQALGEVLVTGTRPTSAVESISWAPVAVRVMVAVGRAGSLPPRAHDRLGEVGAAWVGGLGSDAFRGRGLPDVLPGLTESDARRFLRVVMERERSADDLRRASWEWAGLSSRSLGRSLGPLSAKEVADVVRSVSDAYHDGVAHRARRTDETVAAERQLWGAVVSAVARTPAGSAVVAGAAAGGITLAGGGLVDRVAPRSERELDYLRGMDERTSDEQTRLEYAVAAGMGADVPDLAHFDAWLLDQGRSDPWLASVVDAAGAEFGKSGKD